MRCLCHSVVRSHAARGGIGCAGTSGLDPTLMSSTQVRPDRLRPVLVPTRVKDTSRPLRRQKALTTSPRSSKSSGAPKRARSASSRPGRVVENAQAACAFGPDATQYDSRSPLPAPGLQPTTRTLPPLYRWKWVRHSRSSGAAGQPRRSHRIVASSRVVASHTSRIAANLGRGSAVGEPVAANTTAPASIAREMRVSPRMTALRSARGHGSGATGAPLYNDDSVCFPPSPDTPRRCKKPRRRG